MVNKNLVWDKKNKMYVPKLIYAFSRKGEESWTIGDFTVVIFGVLFAVVGMGYYANTNMKAFIGMAFMIYLTYFIDLGVNNYYKRYKKDN